MNQTLLKLVGMGTNTEEVLSAALMCMVKASDNNKN
jgi:hypothetical protein